MGRKMLNHKRLKIIKYVSQFLVITFLFPNPLAAVSPDEAVHLSKWQKLLHKGNEQERKLALTQLPGLLRYPEIQDKAIFDGILQSLKDKNPSIRATAAASLKQFGRFHPGDLEERKRIALQRELVKKGDSHFAKTFPESLSYHESRNLIVPHLLKALSDNEPMVREEAAKALAFYKNEDTTDGLIKSLHDKDPWVRLNVVFALGEMKTLKAIDPLLNLLEHDSDWRNKFVQQECLAAIGKIGLPKAIGIGGQVHVATPSSRHRDHPEIIIQGTSYSKPPRPVTKIGGFDDETTAKVISVLIRKSDDPYLRAQIIGAFALFKAVEARDILIKATQDPDEKIRRLAIGALLVISDTQPSAGMGVRPDQSKKYGEDILAILKRLSKDPSVQVRATVIAALGKSGDERATDVLVDALKDGDDTIRKNSIEGLGQFKNERILDAMTPFFSERTDLSHLAVQTFMSVVEKTMKERVFVYRANGIRYISRNTFDIPKEAKISKRIVHSTAVGKLIETIGYSSEQGKLSALDLIPKFEDRRIEKVLLRLLDDPSPRLRGRAISLVSYFFDNTIVPRVIGASKDKDAGVREKAVRALGELEDKRTSEPLMERLSDSHSEVRAAALDSLEGHDDPRLSDLTIKLLCDDSVSVRRSAVSNIRKRKDRRAIDALIIQLNDTDFLVPSRSAEALGAIGDKKAVLPLIKALKGEFNKNRTLRGDIDLRRSATKALGLIGDREAVPALMSVLEERDLKTEVIVALGSIKDPRAVPALIRCLTDDDPNVRRLAATALKDMGDPAGLEAVKDIPEYKPPPAVGSATPVRPKDLKPPPSAAISKEPLPGSGYSAVMFGKHERREGKQPPQKEEKTTAIPTLPPVSVARKYDSEPRPSIDIKPILSNLRTDDPRIRREAADSLGDIGNKEATDHLLPLLKDKDEYVRQAAARALGKLEDKKAVEPLIHSLKDSEMSVRVFSAWALGEIQDTRAIEPLCASLFDKETKVKDRSFEALRRFRDPISRTVMVNTLVKGAKTESSASATLSRLISLEGKEVILKALEDPDGDNTKTIKNYIDLMEANIFNVSDIAAKALVDYPDRGMVISELSNYIGNQAGIPARSISLLGSLKDRRALPILLDALKERKDSYYRETVINAIGELGDKEAIEPLLQILVDDKEHLNSRVATARALEKFGDIKTVEPLLQILRNEKEQKELRIATAGALGATKDKRPVEVLIKILVKSNEDNWLRVAAASALGDIGDRRAIGPLEAAMKDPSGSLKHALEIALRKIEISQ
jgi:HEAT repeat protein